jgi:transcriptional regulator with XRE-family HTH domain
MPPSIAGPVPAPQDQQKTEHSQDLGRRLREAREAAGIGAAQAGRELARSSATIWAYERADNHPTPYALRVLSRLYGVSVQWLQTGEGPGPGSAPAALPEPIASRVSDQAVRYPGPPPDVPLPYPLRPPLAPGAPRRYRLVCPACGKSWVPEDLGRHLVTGDGCAQPHSMEDAEALIATAKRDIQPWLDELARLDAQILELQRRRDAIKTKKDKEIFETCIKLVRIQVEKIIQTGPERYEWSDGDHSRHGG